MPEVLRTFESGFVAYAPSGDDRFNDVPYSMELNVLLDELAAGKIGYSSWDFAKRLIRIANQLFGRFDQWLHLQVNNERLTSAHYGLIEDMIHFINTGSPLIELTTRSTMIMYTTRPGYQDNLVNYPLDKRESFGDTLTVNGNEAIAKWVSHPDGLHYLLHTLKYIFGTKTK